MQSREGRFDSSVTRP
nr:unnamed protein product [Callosobruchus chinensis]